MARSLRVAGRRVFLALQLTAAQMALPRLLLMPEDSTLHLLLLLQAPGIGCVLPALERRAARRPLSLLT